MTVLALLVLVSGLLSLSRAAMSDQDCGEGRVRDLDGQCVKKVIIHKETKPVCPKLSIDNGNIFLFGGEWRGGGSRPISITWPGSWPGSQQNIISISYSDSVHVVIIN